MSCYKYWGTIEEIANKLSSYGDLDTEGISALDGTDIEEITKILDDIEVIAHDKEIDFDSAKHILDDEKMNKALQLIRKFYVYIGARLERENAMKILESDDPKAVLDSFHFYDRYIGLIENEMQLAKFNENKTFVFLGSGPLPLTIIMFNMVTGCKCIGIEQDPDVAELSRKVLKRLDLDEGIEIITGDEKTIADLGASGKPGMIVFNKIDAYSYIEKAEDDLTPKTKENISLEELMNTWMAKLDANCFFISAKEKTNMDELKTIIYNKVRELHVQKYPYNDFLYQTYDE